ncbi:hypothetical protein DPX16_10175 [Anabarilius grahami]|uniref:Uncharacterized protein n=1 Tax=Anabarilius grahami TaxID=495550 RepID=A0A3N0XXE3_ANAGA|nr:hypothetical protein DPX16_10175 [Anabarilius grahami]
MFRILPVTDPRVHQLIRTHAFSPEPNCRSIYRKRASDTRFISGAIILSHISGCMRAFIEEAWLAAVATPTQENGLQIPQ